MSEQMVESFEKVGGSFDDLHFHDWHTVEALRALRDQSAIFSFHSTEFGRNGNQFSDNWMFREISNQERSSGHLADQVVAVSGVLKDEVVSLCGVPAGTFTGIYRGIGSYAVRGW